MNKNDIAKALVMSMVANADPNKRNQIVVAAYAQLIDVMGEVRDYFTAAKQTLEMVSPEQGADFKQWAEANVLDHFTSIMDAIATRAIQKKAEFGMELDEYEQMVVDGMSIKDVADIACKDPSESDCGCSGDNGCELENQEIEDSEGIHGYVINMSTGESQTLSEFLAAN